MPTGILTAAAHRHPANPSFAAFQPQRGVSPYTRPSAPYQPQPTFPPQPPQIQSTVPSHSSPPRPPPTRSFQIPPLPSDFVPSEQYHDCKVVYGYDLPKAVRTTTYTQKIGIAGCPIETVPLLAIVRHSWSSYWLRYLCHGHEIFPVFTKHISQAMLATELFSRLNHNKIDLDTVALAHCQGAIPPIPNPTKKQALAALVDEFYEYMSGLIHEPSSQHTAATDQQSNQRILQLEQQLAATLYLILRIPLRHPPHGLSYALKSLHTGNILYHYTHPRQQSCMHATPEYRTTFTTGDNSIGNGIHSSRPYAVANTSTRRTPPIYITATLPSLLPLWSHNTIFYITLAEALSFLPLNNFAETSSLQSRGGTRLITSQHPPTNTPQSQVLLRNNYSFMSSA